MVGLGKGNDPAQVEAEKAFVNSYNSSQSKIFIELEIVPGSTAYETLKVEIANGTAPDIVGPIGIQGRNGLSGVFLDLSSEISASGYDMTRFPQAMTELLRDGTSLVGIPYLINPGYIFYDKDLFAKAKLPDLPKRIGDTWNGQPWTWDTVATLAAQLTLDKNGRKATDAKFDATAIVQYGIDFQWSDLRRTGSCFEAGSFLGTDGSVVIPDGWRAAWDWYYKALWTTHSAPPLKVVNSPLLNNGSTVSSGHVAMAVSWPWAIVTYAGAPDRLGNYNPRFSSWDMAVMPSYNGQTSSPTDSDSFSIVKGTAHPDQAFAAMVAIMADPGLQTAYGGMPAAQADQQAWFTKFDEYLNGIYPSTKVSWSVLQEMENYPAIPSPEADLPDFPRVNDITSAFYTRLQTVQGLDMDKETANLKSSLSKVFGQAAVTSQP